MPNIMGEKRVVPSNESAINFLTGKPKWLKQEQQSNFCDYSGERKGYNRSIKRDSNNAFEALTILGNIIKGKEGSTVQ